MRWEEVRWEARGRQLTLSAAESHESNGELFARDGEGSHGHQALGALELLGVGEHIDDLLESFLRLCETGRD
jgi:hypothetical protein